MAVRSQRPNRPGRHQILSSRNVAGTVEQLQQTQSTEPRSLAIVYFCRGLRRDAYFQPFWDAVGGAVGLAGLMAEFSLRDVRSICKNLGVTASAKKARPERQAGLAQLVRLLYDDGPGRRDLRPLREYYQDIVPACDLDLVREWDRNGHDWSSFQRVCILRNHPAWYQERFLKDLSFLAGSKQRTSTASQLFQSDLEYAETVLSTLIGNKEGVADVPSDFMSVYIMPLLRRLAHPRKYDDGTRDKFLTLVVRCVDVHSRELTSRRGHTLDLVRYAIQRWTDARGSEASAATKQQTELCVGRLVELISTPRNQLIQSLQDIYSGLLLNRKTHAHSYQLLRLILRHARGYELDIDDGSAPGLSRLKDLTARDVPGTGNLWPMGLFLHLDVENATGLFERLSAADTTGNFLAPEIHYSTKTILEQKKFSTSYGDAEIVRYLLLAKSSRNRRAEDTSPWLARARILVRERRKKAEEGREWHHREFWATSAINLCVAAGDMEMLDDTIVWARRFNNQPMVAKALYGPSTFGTDEIRDLLSAVPGEDKDDGPDAAMVRRAVETSGRILIHLMETIKMCLSKHPAENRDWGTLMRLLKLVVDRRLEEKNAASFEALFEPALGSGYVGSGAVEAVWKPTIEGLVVAEGILSESSHLRIEATGTYLLQKFPGKSGDIRADLASFLLHKMKMHLGPHQLRLQVYKVVEVVVGIAKSNQPWLAIPFICDFILDGEADDSAWHRQLLSLPFLSSLPHKAASGLLHSMAEAMRERMREQNARPREKRGADNGEKKAVPSPPAIKVTTVKMMAQLLENSQFVGPSAACDMLLGLLGEARHIDILVSITSSLLSLLKRPAPAQSPDIHTRILNALEERLSPVLPRLSQHKSVSEADWAAVESGEADLPDVAEETPLTSLLASENYDSDSKMSDEAKARLIELLIRIPAQSARFNDRWNKIFLARNGFSLPDERLPSSPACLSVTVRLLTRFPAYFPASTLIMLRDMALTNLNSPPGIARVTEAVKANRDLVNSNAGRHWLAQFDSSGTKAVERFGILAAASLLHRADALSVSKRDRSITVRMVQESILAVADRIIESQAPAGTFERLQNYLHSGQFDNRESWLAWLENCMPVLRTMANKVDELRARRPVPKVLPSSFKLRLAMLPIPNFKQPKDLALAEEIDTLVSALAALVEWLVGRGVPYHHDFSQLKTRLGGGLKLGDYSRVAVGLGRLGGGSVAEEEGAGGGLTVAGYLMLELAGHLLAQRGALGEEFSAVPEVKRMVVEWVGSDDELIRLTGAAVEKESKVVSLRGDHRWGEPSEDFSWDARSPPGFSAWKEAMGGDW
ncbi:uncharacterized protein DNG_10043 [Cephalotrichum gorgonifer]|uniref:Uncharacterized protein n=1 Tax=Cephalotrichum gorgonifer TaxID=2041049 RepID=A0AAE8SZV1_9PEZI|nr:uncharacterized protein DNG_10043 [Cephalotrichum gorgonifer]